jgi:hypothetical protein
MTLYGKCNVLKRQCDAKARFGELLQLEHPSHLDNAAALRESQVPSVALMRMCQMW